MKTFFATLMVVIVVSASAFDYLAYNRTSATVTNRPIGKVERSVSVLPSFPGNIGVLVYSGSASSNWNGVVPLLSLNWCKVSNNLVVPLTATESNSIISAQSAAGVADRQQAELQAKVASTNRFLIEFFQTPEGRGIFAFMESTMDALNAIRGGMAGNTNMPLLTLTQLTNAIKVRIAAQANNAP